MKATSHSIRAFAMAGLMLAVFVFLAAKICLIQTVWRAEYVQKQEDQGERTVKRQAQRGRILDCNGNVLAQSLPVCTVCADPIALKKIHASQIPLIAQQLANLLELDYQWVRSRLDTERHYVVIKRKVDKETIAQIRALRIPGLVFEPDSLRNYPNGPLAPHVIGFVGFDGTGVTGVEQRQERYLRGQGGWRQI